MTRRKVQWLLPQASLWTRTHIPRRAPEARAEGATEVRRVAETPRERDLADAAPRRAGVAQVAVRGIQPLRPDPVRQRTRFAAPGTVQGARRHSQLGRHRCNC